MCLRICFHMNSLIYWEFSKKRFYFHRVLVFCFRFHQQLIDNLALNLNHFDIFEGVSVVWFVSCSDWMFLSINQYRTEYLNQDQHSDCRFYFGMEKMCAVPYYTRITYRIVYVECVNDIHIKSAQYVSIHQSDYTEQAIYINIQWFCARDVYIVCIYSFDK